MPDIGGFRRGETALSKEKGCRLDVERKLFGEQRAPKSEVSDEENLKGWRFYRQK